MTKNFWKESFKAGLVAISLSILIINGTLAQQNRVKSQISVEESKDAPPPQKLTDIENDNASFTINLSVDRKNKTFKVGDTMTVSFTTTKDCHLTLFNVDTTGKVQIIFPNQFQQDNFVKAGATYRIPQEGATFVFKAQGPAGSELIKAVATVESVEVVKARDTKPAGGIQQVMKSQSFVAAAVDKALDKVDEKKWAEAEMTVKIVE
jgi:hypothetical protein